MSSRHECREPVSRVPRSAVAVQPAPRRRVRDTIRRSLQQALQWAGRTWRWEEGGGVHRLLGDGHGGRGEDLATPALSIKAEQRQLVEMG